MTLHMTHPLVRQMRAMIWANTKQGKQKVRTDADGHILHRMQLSADYTWCPLYDNMNRTD